MLDFSWRWCEFAFEVLFCMQPPLLVLIVRPASHIHRLALAQVEVDCWTTCPNATAWAKKNGLDPTNGYNAYHWFESTLYNMLVKDMGRTVVAWVSWVMPEVSHEPPHWRRRQRIQRPSACYSSSPI